MKIKLKDVSYEQYEKWYNDYCGKTICKECPLNSVSCYTAEKGCWVYHKDLFSDKFLNQEIEIEDEPILDAQEKTYLENVLRPFKNRKIRIIMDSFAHAKYSYIRFLMDSIDGTTLCENIALPYFEKGTMYKGMEPDKPYTLKELGLFEDDK